ITKSETDVSQKPITTEEESQVGTRASFLSSVSNNLNVEEEKEVNEPKTQLHEKRYLRAYSMPTMSSEPLSDISEKSTEGSLHTALLSADNNAPSRKKYFHSAPGTPRRGNSETEINSERPKSELKVNSSAKSESRRLSVAFAVPSIVDGAESGSHANDNVHLDVQKDENGSRRSSIGSAPPSPKSPQLQLGDNIPEALKPAESLPSICLPANDIENDVTSEKNEENQNVEATNIMHDVEKKDAQTQKDESDLSSCTTSTPENKANQKLPLSRTPALKRKPMIPVRRRTSRSISPNPRRHHYQIIRIQPAIPPNANIRHILENVAKTEGPFLQPEEALRAAISTFTQDAWTTKVEGMLAITRLASFHPSVLQKELHIIILALVYEVKNLRSSVSRSAIFTLGDLFTKMKKQIEPDMDLICQALLHKCGENVSFIREDIERALANMVEEMPQTKSVLALINGGANHRNMNVRKTAAQFLQYLVEKMGPTKCLMGPRDIGEHLLPAAAKFVMDSSPITRYYGRKIFGCLMQHSAFDKLLRKHITPGTYRNICGILESIKRRITENQKSLRTEIEIEKWAEESTDKPQPSGKTNSNSLSFASIISIKWIILLGLGVGEKPADLMTSAK
ncbi:protein FAM179B-like protein, partial [Dinothrombium tinctorium]